MRAFSAALPSSCSGVSSPVMPKSLGAQDHDRHAVVDAGHLDAVDVIDGRCRSAAATPQLEPATSRNSSGIAAAVPGTPSMRASPSYSTAPSGVGTCATAMLPVFTMWMRTGVVVAGDRHEPVLDRPRADAGENVAAVLAVADFGLVDHDLQEQIVDVGMRRARDALMTATLLVSGCAPPTPSICRASGEPMAASSTRSRSSRSAGRSRAWKYRPFEVPPRISVQGMAVSIALQSSVGASTYFSPFAASRSRMS